MGPGIAGAVFGAGWWFWVDAVVCSAVKISFLHYLPGEPPSPSPRSWSLWPCLRDSLDFELTPSDGQFLGIFASLAALMFNCVDKNEIGYDYYSPYGETEWRYDFFWSDRLLSLILPVDLVLHMSMWKTDRFWTKNCGALVSGSLTLVMMQLKLLQF